MLYTVFNQLVLYLGGWGATVVATLFFMAIVRIGIAFVFKIFRLNLDYKATLNKTGSSIENTVYKYTGKR